MRADYMKSLEAKMYKKVENDMSLTFLCSMFYTTVAPVVMVKQQTLNIEHF